MPYRVSPRRPPEPDTEPNNTGFVVGIFVFAILAIYPAISAMAVIGVLTGAVGASTVDGHLVAFLSRPLLFLQALVMVCLFALRKSDGDRQVYSLAMAALAFESISQLGAALQDIGHGC